MTLRIVTWNLWWRFGPWEARQAPIEATLRALDADVLCLQETWVAGDAGGRDRQVDRLGATLGLHAVAADPPLYEGVGIANAVLSRWPISRHRVVPLPGADGERSHRHALVATTDAPRGPITVVSTHLEHRLTDSATRQRQTAALAALVAEVRGDPATAFPVIVGGDLNAVPWSDEVRALTGASPVAVPGLAFTDCWEHAGDGSAGHTWAAANPHLANSTMPNRRIDYLLVSWPRRRPIGNPLRCWLAGTEPVDGVQPSDHYAVAADLVSPQ